MKYYIHIPFCRNLCPYCKFALTPVFDETRKRRYLAYLQDEIRKYFLKKGSHKEKIETIYFGGGTPSILSKEEIESLLLCFPNYREALEITLESNPEDITKKYLEGIISLGINRLSLGVQSIHDYTLKKIRRAPKKRIYESLRNIEYILESSGRLGKISINIDFILGLPYTIFGETLMGIEVLHKEFPYIRHTSVYMLEDSLYPKEWNNYLPDEKMIEEEYKNICKYFEKIGWHHYEISNWAQYGYESIHNRGYWDQDEYIGFGLSATSYQNKIRWENSRSFSGYYEGKYAYTEELDEKHILLEKMIYDLRTFRLSESGFSKKVLENLIEKGYIEIQDEKIILTPAGIFRENSILGELADVAQW